MLRAAYCARSEYPGGKPTRTDALLQFEVASRRS
jgi:hypothetical protein